MIKQLRDTYDETCENEIKAALKVGSIKKVEEFDNHCRTILMEANDYLQRLIDVRKEFFDNDKQTDEEITKLKDDFF